MALQLSPVFALDLKGLGYIFLEWLRQIRDILNIVNTQTQATIPWQNINQDTAALSASSGTISVTALTRIVTITPAGACTFNATSGGIKGQEVTYAITTSGASSYVLTWGTNYHTTGTLATGVTTARYFTVSFISDGTTWWETARTTVQT